MDLVYQSSTGKQATTKDFLEERFRSLGIEMTPQIETIVTETVIEIDDFLREQGVLVAEGEIFVSKDID